MIDLPFDDRPLVEAQASEVIEESHATFVFPTSTSVRPRFGSQLEDFGEVFIGSWVEIESTEFREGRICHKIKNDTNDKIQAGSVIAIRRNEIRRQNLRRMHSSVHLLCSLNNHKMVRGFVGPDVTKVQFKGNVEEISNSLLDLKSEFHHYVDAALPVKTKLMSLGEMVEHGNVKEYHSGLTGNIRVVEIVGLDTRVCLGTHVSSTSDIGAVIIEDPQPEGDQDYKINISLQKI